MEVVFFASQDEFRAWLTQNHAKRAEIHVGFYKVGSGLPTITYKEAVDQALCFGWIDGVRRGIDQISYMNRFTPRKQRSIWSAVNIKRVGELTDMGLMHPAGLRAFETRDVSKQNLYSFEQSDETLKFSDAQEAAFRASADAWAFFQKAPPSYTKAAIWWVISAKQEATREKRLAELIDCSARGLRIPSLRRSTDRS